MCFSLVYLHHISLTETETSFKAFKQIVDMKMHKDVISQALLDENNISDVQRDILNKHHSEIGGTKATELSNLFSLSSLS